MGFKEFPIDIFPGRLQLSMKKMAEAYSVNVDPVAVAMITILSAAIGNTTRVLPKKGWLEPVFLWSVIIGPSGSGKTPFVTKLLENLYRRQSQAYQVYQGQMQGYERRVMRVTNRNAVIRRPQLLRYIVSDITIESLALAMEGQPRGILSYQDELSGWILSHDQYRARGGDRQKYLELWNCNPWMKDRVSGSQFIRNTGCALLGGIQPLVLPRVFQEDSFVDGLLPRFIFTSLSERPYSDLAITDEDMYEWNSLLHYCYQIALVRDEQEDAIRYRIIPFSPDAHHIFAKFTNELKDRQQGILQVFIPKLISYAVRLAGILYILRDTKEENINVDAIKDSIKLVDYFLGQVKGILGLYGKGGSQYSEQDERLISVLKVLKEKVANGELSIDMIAQEFNKDIPGELRLTNQLVAYKLLNMGLKTRITKGHSYVAWEQSAIEKLFSVY